MDEKKKSIYSETNKNNSSDKFARSSAVSAPFLANVSSIYGPCYAGSIVLTYSFP